MSITITITDPTPAQIAALFGTQDSAPVEETKPKTERKPPADKPKAEEPKAEANTPSHDEVVAAAQALVSANGREALAELLGEYDAKNLSGVAEDKRAAFIAACEKKTK